MDKMRINSINAIDDSSKTKIRINVFIFGLMMFFVFTNSNRMLGLSDYYIYPIAFIVTSLLSFFMNKTKIHLDDIFYSLFVILISFFMGNLISFFEIDRGYLLSYILYILFAVVVVIQDYSAKEIKFLLTSYIISATIIALMILIFRVEYGIGSSRYSIKFRGNDVIEVNYLAAYLVGPAFFSFIRLVGAKNLLKKTIYLLLSVIISTGIFLTSSRAAFLGLVICLSFIVLDYQSNMVTNKLKNSITIFILLFVGVVLFVNFFPYDVVHRLVVNSYFDSSNMQRILLWKHAIESILDSPTSLLFGYGAVPTSNILLEITGYNGDAHNTFLTFWLHTGIIGIISIIFVFLKLLIKSIKLKAIALAGLLLYLLFISIILAAGLSLSFWFNLLLTIIIIRKYAFEKQSIGCKSILQYLTD